MALLTGKGELPKGAVRLTEQEAILYQWKQIKSWPHLLDVWPFKIGIPLLFGVGALTAIRINTAIRSKLFLRGFGKYVSHYTVTLGTVSIIGFTHYMFVTDKLLVYQTACPVCIETKAILLQLTGCIIYPSIFSMIANCTLANKYATYRVPYFTDGQGMFKLWLDFVKPLRKKLLGHVILNMVAAAFVTYSESKSLATIRTKLLEKANKADVESLEMDTPKKNSNRIFE